MRANEKPIYNHAIRCMTCGFEQSVDINRYASVSSDSQASLDELVRKTIPDIEDRESSALAAARQLAARISSISSSERRLYMLESLMLIAPILDYSCKRSNNVSNDRWSMIGMYLLLAIPFGIMAVAVFSTIFSKHPDTIMSLAGYASGAIALIGLIIFMVAHLSLPKRALKRIGLPMLQSGFAPLKPSMEDIEIVFQAAKIRKVKFVRLVNIRRLYLLLSSLS